jgi:hypothetical protein
MVDASHQRSRGYLDLSAGFVFSSQGRNAAPEDSDPRPTAERDAIIDTNSRTTCVRRLDNATLTRGFIPELNNAAATKFICRIDGPFTRSR